MMYSENLGKSSEPMNLPLPNKAARSIIFSSSRTFPGRSSRSRAGLEQRIGTRWVLIAGQQSLAWTEKHQYLLLIALVAMGLVLGVFIVKSLKTIRLDQTQK